MVISEDLAKHINEKNGVVLIAGRPGIGKTTFLMESMNELTDGRMEEIAATLLDPVNYYGYTSYGAIGEKSSGGSMMIVEGERRYVRSIWQHYAQIYPQMEVVFDDKFSPLYNENSSYFEMIIEYLANLKRIKYILIDQLARVPYEGVENSMCAKKEKFLSSCLSFLVNLAAKYDVTIIVEHNANRNLEQRKNKRPGIADLALYPEVLSGVNSIIILYRESYYYKKTDYLDLEIQEIRLRKIWMKKLTTNYIESN